MQIKYNEFLDEEENFDESSKPIEEQSFNYENEINEYRSSIPYYCNLLDNYNILMYKGIKIPRFSFVNEYYFKKYKIPFNELFNKINYDYILTKDFLFNLSIILNNKNINKYQNIANGINKPKNNNNEKVGNLQIQQDNSFEYINNKSPNNLAKKDNFLNKKKNIKKIFKLKFYGDNEINKNFLQKKRGRKSSKKSKHYHSALDDDNILRKIQVHFLTFLVSFTNDYIDALSINKGKKNDIHFKHLDYKFKKVINHKSIEKLKVANIGQILKNKVSPKNKVNENINQIIYLKICQQFPDLKNNYFNKLFNEFFIEYYNYIHKFRNVANFYYLNNRKEKNIGKNGSKSKYENTSIEEKPFFIID